MSPSHRVRLLLMQVEQVCLTEVYPDAIPCLMEAKEICIRHYQTSSAHASTFIWRMCNFNWVSQIRDSSEDKRTLLKRVELAP